jgi:hypothetical protein
MADETNNPDEQVDNRPAKAETTVKKRVVKKKVAKKKVTAKKKVATKKKVTAKKKTSKPKAQSSAPATVAQNESIKGDDDKMAAVETTATPVSVATAGAQAPEADVTESKTASSSSKVPSSNVVVQQQLQEKTPEESSMSTETKSSSGFWIKVLFWLIIIILGFMYIRSIAKKPVTESTSESTAVSQIEAVTADTHEQTVEDEAISADVPAAPLEDPSAAEHDQVTMSGDLADTETESDLKQTQVEASVSETIAPVPEASNNLVSGSSVAPVVQVVPAASEQVVDQQGEPGQKAEMASSLTSESATAEQPAQDASTAQQQQHIQSMHAESVTKILKEFDELRDAAQAEMEAMQNRIQAERELREAMMPPPPPIMWRAPAYAPYGPGRPGSYPGYYNYR